MKRAWLHLATDLCLLTLWPTAQAAAESPQALPTTSVELSILVPIVLVLLAIAGAYWSSVRTQARKAEFAFVNEQLRSLYGPLFSLSQASEAAWETFRAKYRPDGAFFNPANPPNEMELKEWMRWMRVVFGPMNELMVKTIVEHADLIEGDMPKSFLTMIAHAEGYKAVMDKWEQGDYSEFASLINYPAEMNAEISHLFAVLKARQRRLMG